MSAGKKPDTAELVREQLQIMMRRGLVVRAERLYKKPKPGRKRLTRWPRKLQPVQMSEQVCAELCMWFRRNGRFVRPAYASFCCAKVHALSMQVHVLSRIL